LLKIRAGFYKPRRFATQTSIRRLAVSFDGATKVMHPGEHQWKHLIGGASFVSLRPVFHTGLCAPIVLQFFSYQANVLFQATILNLFETFEIKKYF
jgi:hypothetical protein